MPKLRAMYERDSKETDRLTELALNDDQYLDEALAQLEFVEVECEAKEGKFFVYHPASEGCAWEQSVLLTCPSMSPTIDFAIVPNMRLMISKWDVFRLLEETKDAIANA